MPSSIGSKVTQLIVGALAISSLGLSTINSIRDNNPTQAIQRAAIFTGDSFVLNTEDSTPSVKLNDDSDILTWPTLPGTPHCIGNTGALLCQVTIKLTGSGGHRNSNAGSFACETSTCSIVDARVFTEAVPKANERLYGGWTTTPNTASGAQVFNYYAASSGATVIGSGSYVGIGANGLNIEKDVPPGSTFKFTWALGNGSEDYSSYKAAAVIRYYKYYNQ